MDHQEQFDASKETIRVRRDALADAISKSDLAARRVSDSIRDTIMALRRVLSPEAGTELLKDLERIDWDMQSGAGHHFKFYHFHLIDRFCRSEEDRRWAEQVQAASGR